MPTSRRVRDRLAGSVTLLLFLLVVPAPSCRPVEQVGVGNPVRTHPTSNVEAVLINGGGRPQINFQSHLLHVRQLYRLLLRSGIRASDVAIFSADGAATEADLAVRELQPETDFWLLEGTRLERPLRTQISYENSVVDGAALLPATGESLRGWFENAAGRLGHGDTLLLYVTDHGTKNAEDTSNNRITLWGEKESLSVTELGELLALLPPGVRVVALMSQCFSGAFANLMYTGATDGVPRGNVCGFFSSTPERPAYGCYPENRDKDNVGHSFRFIEGLGTGASFPETHARVLVSDRTPDVPLKTSDVYLEKVLDAAARQHGKEPTDLIDELLREAWRDKGAWEPEIRLLDRIGQAFGYFSPRSLTELTQQSNLLPEISQQFGSYGGAWQAALRSLAAENLDRFVAEEPEWQERASDIVLAGLEADGRRALTHALLQDLTVHTRADTDTAERLDRLKEKADLANAARYRMQVRLGVVLRMQAVLTSIAGRVHLATHGTQAERAAYEALVACEAFTLGRPEVASSAPVAREPFPSYDEELKLAETVLPGWMGIRFRQTNPTSREALGLEAGAVSIVTVYPKSPAQDAGLEVGDIILGPPRAPFIERDQIREWVMTAAIGQPRRLVVQRGDQKVRVRLTPKPYPLKWPELPGPPKVGSLAPPLRKLQGYRGPVPVELTSGGPYLLFFWATWCAPCKAALPEVLAFEHDRDATVVAITDELAEQLDAFFSRHEGPFPEAVAVDEFRRAFLAYGVSGTPSFVLVDAAGRVQKSWTGYRADAGLEIPGWSWAERRPGARGG